MAPSDANTCEESISDQNRLAYAVKSAVQILQAASLKDSQSLIQAHLAASSVLKDASQAADRALALPTLEDKASKASTVLSTSQSVPGPSSQNTAEKNVSTTQRLPKAGNATTLNSFAASKSQRSMPSAFQRAPTQETPSKTPIANAFRERENNNGPTASSTSGPSARAAPQLVKLSQAPTTNTVKTAVLCTPQTYENVLAQPSTQNIMHSSEDADRIRAAKQRMNETQLSQSHRSSRDSICENVPGDGSSKRRRRNV